MAEERNQTAPDRDPDAEGFTFVDKRRVAADPSESQPVPEPQAAQPASGDADTPADLESGDAPDTTHQIALYALGLLQMNAFQQLGLISDPKTGKANRDLAQARVAIDCVAALASVLDAPDSLLDPNLRQDVRRVLTDLRLNFVTQSKMAAGEIQ